MYGVGISGAFLAAMRKLPGKSKIRGGHTYVIEQEER
jgi:hypothetical protein